MRRTTVALLATVTTVGVVQATGPAAWASVGHRTLVAAPHGTGTTCTHAHPCSIKTAVGKAAAGDTVWAERGVYHTSGITVTREIRLVGQRGAVIDAAVAHPTRATARGIIITGAAAARSVVSGFIVEHAAEEGILAMNTRGLTIKGNVVVRNDTGVAAQAFDECKGAGPIPGDCGEGLHLWAVTGSFVVHNVVSWNAGGILLTDETGPTARNVIGYNVSTNNVLDCGITLAGHNPQAIDARTGNRQPTKGGVFNNIIIGNVVARDGIKGEGAGIIMAGGAPFAGVYGNWVLGNAAWGNGLAGVAVHEHFAADLNDNVIVGNRIGRNNLGGDTDFTPADKRTTGILVASGPTPGLDYAKAGLPLPVPITGTVIRDNRISNDYYGIWLLNTKDSVIVGNSTRDVTVKVSRH